MTTLAAKVRRDFPILDTDVDGNRIIYLDSAATSLTPKAVTDEMARYYHQVGANIHRGKHFLSEQASDDVERVRLVVARLTGYMGNEVVFTANATAGLNLVAGGLPLAEDDTVLVSFEAHHSALLPWRARANVRTIPLTDGHDVDHDRYAELLAGRPKVVVLNHCSNVSGTYVPVERMAALAKRAGAITVVDAAQSIGHRAIDTADIDFLAFSAHKMLGPTGIGVLCGRYDQLNRITPSMLGGGVVDWVDAERYDLRKVPHRFEAGTPHIAGVYGLGAAIEYLNAIGFDALAGHDTELGRAMRTEIATRPYLRAVGAAEAADNGAILSLTVDGVHNLKEIAHILSDSYGVMCRTGHMCAQPFVDRMTGDEVLRISGYVYNDTADIAVVFAALDEITRSLGVRA
jgi:cysteine desulfurase / selenocysteine lyase